jgi:hypothetical protein
MNLPVFGALIPTEGSLMAQYTPPLRDVQFVLHELLKVTDTFKTLPPHAEVDV